MAEITWKAAIYEGKPLINYRVSSEGVLVRVPFVLKYTRARYGFEPAIFTKKNTKDKIIAFHKTSEYPILRAFIHIYNEEGFMVIKSKPVYIHRIVAETFIPNPKEHKYIKHKNLDVYDNSVDNLQWIFDSNVTIARLLNKKPPRSKRRINQNSVVTPYVIHQTHKLYKKGLPYRVIAKILKISESSAWKAGNSEDKFYY